MAKDCDDPFGIRGMYKEKDNTKYAVYLPKNARLIRNTILMEEERAKLQTLSIGEKQLLNEGQIFNENTLYEF